MKAKGGVLAPPFVSSSRLADLSLNAPRGGHATHFSGAGAGMPSATLPVRSIFGPRGRARPPHLPDHQRASLAPPPRLDASPIQGRICPRARAALGRSREILAG